MAGLREPPPPHHSNAQSAELQGARPGRGVARGRQGTWCGDDVPAVSSGLKVSTGSIFQRMDGTRARSPVTNLKGLVSRSSESDMAAGSNWRWCGWL